jgi:hypothetical protein
MIKNVILMAAAISLCWPASPMRLRQGGGLGRGNDAAGPVRPVAGAGTMEITEPGTVERTPGCLGPRTLCYRRLNVDQGLVIRLVVGPPVRNIGREINRVWVPETQDAATQLSMEFLGGVEETRLPLETGRQRDERTLRRCLVIESYNRTRLTAQPGVALVADLNYTRHDSLWRKDNNCRLVWVTFGP